MPPIEKLLSALTNARFLRGVLFHRVLAGSEHRHILSQQPRTVIDIGANVGQFALAAREYSPQSRIHSFEPLPGPAATHAALFRDDPQVTLHRCAIGPAQGEATMHVSKREDSSSLLAISDQQDALFPGTAESHQTTVTVRRLLDCIAKQDIQAPALLKIDVQGFEGEVLKGCEEALPLIDAIYCECSFLELYSGQSLASDVIEFLHQRGFRLAGLYNPTYRDGLCIQADLHFLKK